MLIWSKNLRKPSKSGPALKAILPHEMINESKTSIPVHISDADTPSLT